MKLWSEARTIREKRELLDEALRVAGTQEAAARMLGISRMHYYRLKKALTEAGTSSDTVTDASTREGVTARDASDALTGDTTRVRQVDVTITHGKQLTYTDSVATFAHVSNSAFVEADERTKREVFNIPAAEAAWLDQEALRRKHQGERHRAAKSPIVTEAIRFYREHLERLERERAEDKPESEE